MNDFNTRQFGSGDESVVGQVGSRRVAVGVVQNFFEKSLSNTLCNSTVNLSIEQHRVENLAGIVTCNLTQVLDATSLGVDFNDSDVSAERESCS